MDDIEMNNINQIEVDPKNQDEEDSCKVLDNIQIHLKTINNTFTEALNLIKINAPFIEKGTEPNMQKEQNNQGNALIHDKEKPIFNETLTSISDQMKEHFGQILEMTKKLKNYEEFNMTENQLKEKLNKLKDQNIKANEEMNKKLKNIENIYNDLNVDNSMKNEIINRDDIDDNIDI